MDFFRDDSLDLWFQFFSCKAHKGTRQFFHKCTNLCVHTWQLDFQSSCTPDPSICMAAPNDRLPAPLLCTLLAGPVRPSCKLDTFPFLADTRGNPCKLNGLPCTDICRIWASSSTPCIESFYPSDQTSWNGWHWNQISFKWGFLRFICPWNAHHYFVLWRFCSHVEQNVSEPIYIQFEIPSCDVDSVQGQKEKEIYLGRPTRSPVYNP